MADLDNTPDSPSATDGPGLERRDRTRRKPAARTSTLKTARPAVAAPPKSRRPRNGRKPARTLVILTMVGGLIATVALPAYAAVESATADPMTLQQVAVDDAQSLVVASDAGAAELSRSSYSATTAEEIEKKKAEEAAAERARIAAELAASAASSSSSSSGSRANVDLTMVAPGTGEVRWPLSGFTVGDRTFARGGAHMGTDMLAPCGEPLFAAAAGVVRVSQESYGGYGVAVTIDHVINGQRVSTLYGHMTYGSRAVQAGQTVSAGQIIGLVGSTGRSTACHLHFETYINGSVVDSYEWLLANAG
ncbi:murein DD-endopeptidase MepM/ murein hydrolase activator NlpD [Microbacterium sp. SLBN-154]|uniref:M23 family metallopeptidase n=1 Tax=Microbacterium sp. SLBN-154 TaxID=2768458 RepID=UPI00115361F6|nr:M23 family metallopeptidase [Microbacterium sp. SLBN-154]TQK20167.1 murein DD-endopeptidase MepM/ murein hydrolase activator NlpD [Microbacterium sp. SLBN-154]